MRIINYTMLLMIFIVAPNCIFGQEQQIEIKEAYQATPYIGDPNNPDYSLTEKHSPEKCFDGDLSTFNHTADFTSESVWIEFDLGSIFQINTITINNRKEVSYRLHNFYISVSDQPFGRGNRAPETEWLATFEGQKNFSLNKVGRYVRITLENGTNENVIHLAEVSFYGEVDKESLTTARIETFNEAIKNNDERLVEDMIREVRPNSQSFVLAAEVGNYDLYELLVDEARLPDNKSIEKAIDNNHKDIYSLGLSNGGDATAALKYAIARGNDTAIKKCLAKKGDPKYAVTWAVSREDDDLANLLMEKYNISADKLLDECISQMNVSMIKFALETGNADPSPHLMKVLEAKKDDLAKMMVDLGADPNKGIDFVVKNNNEALVEYFISAGAEVTNSSLVLHASKNNFTITELLVTAGANPNIGLVPSIEANKEDISIFLINSGADPAAGLVPAINSKKTNLVEALINAGAEADKGIVQACTAGLNDIVNILIAGGADPNKGIEISLTKNFTAVAETLIQNGADGGPYLSIPIINGNEKLVSLILDLGADPQTGMEAACKHGRTSILKKLIDLGADGNNGDYMTMAISSNSADMVPILFAQGVSPNAVYPDGGNYIHKAARNIGGVHTVMKLHEGGVDVTKKDNKGNTPLHVAATSGKENVSLIEALVNLGCDVNAVNNSGETPRKIAKGMKTKNTLKKLGGLKKL